MYSENPDNDVDARMQQPPHPTLTRHYKDGAERRSLLNRWFDSTAPHYDSINRILSLGTGDRYRKEALLRAGAATGMQFLDVGCGTGSIAAHAKRIVQPGGQVIALDPSRQMLRLATVDRVADAVQGLAEWLPFREKTFDMLAMGYALRHVEDLQLTFREYMRVLKPGGVLLLLEFIRPPSGPFYQLVKYYLRNVAPAVTRLLTRNREAQALMVYHWETVESCVGPETIVEVLRRVGFEHIDVHLTLGFFGEYTATKP